MILDLLFRLNLFKEKKAKEAKPEKVTAEKIKSNEKVQMEATLSKQEGLQDPVEDDAGYLVPAELLAQKQLAVEEKVSNGKERSSLGLTLGELYFCHYVTIYRQKVEKSAQCSSDDMRIHFEFSVIRSCYADREFDTNSLTHIVVKP